MQEDEWTDADREYLMALEHIDLKTKAMMKNYTKKQLAKKYACYFITLHYPKDHPTRKVAKFELEEGEN